jgi:hypothetical protein
LAQHERKEEASCLCMAETSEKKKKRRMAEKREAETKKHKKTALTTKWPLIKPKQNLQITHLKDTDLFTVRLFNPNSYLLFFFLFNRFKYMFMHLWPVFKQYVSLLFCGLSIVICVPGLEGCCVMLLLSIL